MGGSEYMTVNNIEGGLAPQVDTQKARTLYEALSEAIEAGMVASCHDCSDGGLAVALAESAFAGGFGMTLDISPMAMDNPVVALFSESQSRFVATVSPEKAEAFEAKLAGSAFTKLGAVTSKIDLVLQEGDAVLLKAPLADLKAAWKKPLQW